MKAVQSTANVLYRMNKTVDDPTMKRALERMKIDTQRVTSEVRKLESGIEALPAKQARVAQGFESWQGKITGVSSMIHVAQTAISGLTKIGSIIDQNTANTARLGLINDGLRTTKQLQNDIFAAAERSRGSYNQMQQSVAKLGLLAGDAFGSNKEIVAFTETLNKAFVVGGASAMEQSSGTYQLMQAMSSGRLQGDEYRSIIENAPMLAQAIEDYMRNVQHAKGSMKDWASEGMLTADVIKAALFGAADDINAKFAEMPMTFAQMWQSFVNKLLKAAQPFMQKWSKMFNSQQFQQGLNRLVNSLMKVFNVVMKVVNFAMEHSVILYGILSGFVGMFAQKLVKAVSGFTTNLVAGFKKGESAVKQFNAVCNSNIIFLVASAVSTLTMKLNELYHTNDDFRYWVDTMNSGLEAVRKTYKELFAQAYQTHALMATGASAEAIMASGDRDSLVELGVYNTRHGQAASWLADYIEKNPLEDGSLMDPSNKKREFMIQTIMRQMKLHNDPAGRNLATKNAVEKIMIDGFWGPANDAILSSIAGDMSSTAANVADIAGELDSSDESIKYIVDAVTDRTVNNINLQTTAPEISINYNGNISTEIDKEEMSRYVSDQILEGIFSSANKAYSY